MTMKATAAAACMAFAAMTATVSESAEKDNGIPEVARPEVARAVEEAARRPHPRLFADADGFAALKARLGKEELFTAGAEFIRATADPILKAKPCERIKEGKRLLGVSRTALYRINTLALAYRLYGNKGARVRHDWWSKSGGVTEFLVNCLPCDAQGTFKRTDTTTW